MSDPHAKDDPGEDLFFEREGGEPESLDVDSIDEVFEIVSSVELKNVAQYTPAHADDAAAFVYPPRRIHESRKAGRLITATGALLVVMVAGWLYVSGSRQEPSGPAAPASVTAPIAPFAPSATSSTAAAPSAASTPAASGARPSLPAQLPPPRIAPAPITNPPRPNAAVVPRATTTAPSPARTETRAVPTPDERVARVPPEPVKSSPPAPIAAPPAAPEIAPASPPVTIAAPSSLPAPVRTPDALPVTATVPSPAPAIATSATPPPVIAEEDALRAVLDRYRSAYGRLDAAAAHDVYPRIDTRALSRAFDQLSMQQIDFASCDIRVNGDRGSAGCTGVARFVTKVGSKTPRIESRFWNFDLRKSGQSWRIEKIEMR